MIIKKLIGLLANIAENDSWPQRPVFGPRRPEWALTVHFLKYREISPLDKSENGFLDARMSAGQGSVVHCREPA